MPSSLVPLLVVAFVCLIMGVLAGLLINSLRGDREEEVEPGKESPPGGRPGRYAPLVRLWREKTTETLIVEVDGKSYLAATPLSAAQRQELEKAAADLADWLGVALAGDEPGQPPAPPAENLPTAVPAVAAVAVAAPVAALQPAPKQGQPLTPQPAPFAASQPVPAIRAVPSQPLPAGKDEPKSIVGQIDAILKDLLVGTPFEDRGIYLSEDPRKGVIVWIGARQYEGIDNVPDTEIKAIIRSAVAEWERRQVK